jgi:3-polyprenyl-4-hydroxybenzoate decarboxylase
MNLPVAGALRGAPVDLVACETVPLEVPATAEIVLEARFRPMPSSMKDPSANTPATWGRRAMNPSSTSNA